MIAPTPKASPGALGRAIVGLALTASLSTASAQGFVDAPRDKRYVGPIRLEVDATDLDHRVFQVSQVLPVEPGRLTLFFPRFLPGTHGPSGNVSRMAGLQVRAGQVQVPWTRDTVDSYAFHLEVPSDAKQLELNYQFLSPVSREAGRMVMTRAILNLQWNSVLLYPAGHYATAIEFVAKLKLPKGWTQASALRVAKQTGDEIEFEPVSLETLVDSPIFAGAHMARVDLDPPGTARPVVLHMFADEPSQLKASEEQLNAHRRLVQQADKLFGARHFRHYDFLLSISEHLGGIGLEHHESSENGVRTDYFKDWAKKAGRRELLPHEFVHSWNGKFRRPQDLWSAHFNLPMRNSLLWLYEGQTQYWGRVLAARSGLVNPEQARDGLANVAATFQHRAGRVWRNLQDTTNEGTIGARGTQSEWGDWQRRADYYDEATLIWLDADTWIREKSGESKSLDDFARAFFGMHDGRVAPLTYTFNDIVIALNAIVPNDWAGFLRERLDTTRALGPLDGIDRSGWKLAWAETPSEFAKAQDGEASHDDFGYSLGLYLKRDGQVMGVMWNSPAFKAGMSKALQVLAVNAMAYKADRMAAAVSANKEGAAPIELLVKEGDTYRHIKLDYRDGLRYPRLQRIDGSLDRLHALISPRP